MAENDAGHRDAGVLTTLTRSPLIEAVIDRQFAGGLSALETPRLRDALANVYPNVARVPTVSLNFDGDEVSITEEIPNFRLHAADASETSIIHNLGFGTSQLYPYRDWSALFSRFKRDFNSAQQVLDGKKLSRIAARYINRIDVPIVGEIANYEEYIEIYPRLPGWTETVSAFNVTVGLPQLDDDDFNITLRCASAPPVVDGYASFLFDIDVARQFEEPVVDVDIDDILGSIRETKNRIFLNYITEKAMESFR